jgi:hypothetical protein
MDSAIRSVVSAEPLRNPRVRQDIGVLLRRLVLGVALGAPLAVAQEPPTGTDAAVSEPAPEARPSPADTVADGPARLFFAPTARSVPRGKGSVGLSEVLFPWGEIGVTDRLSVQGIGVLPLDEFSSGGLVLGPKVRLLGRSRVQAALGVYQGLPTSAGGIGYGVVTLGSADASATVGWGYGYGGLADSEGSRGVVFLGADKALGRRWRLMAEAYLGGQGLGLPNATLVLGTRMALGHWSLDVGAVMPFYSSKSGPPVPILTIARGF